MDMKLEQCTKFFKENKGSLSMEQTEVAIGIMDYMINLYNDWNLEYGSYLFARSCSEVSQDEKKVASVEPLGMEFQFLLSLVKMNAN